MVQEGLGAGRHLAIAANGDIYLAGRNGLVAMRDKNGDGKADETAPFGDVKGTEVRIFKNWLYVSDDVGVYRYPLKKGELAPTGARADRGGRISDGTPARRQDLRARSQGHAVRERRRALELLPGEGPPGRIAGP